MLKQLLFSLLLFSAVSAKDIDISVTDPLPTLFENNNTFAFDIMPGLDNPGSNLLYSPFSIFTSLSMVYTGADGTTEEALKQGLHLSISQEDLPKAYIEYFKVKGDPRLSVANAVWANQDTYFLPDFLETLQESFQAGATSLDFQHKKYTAAIINEWIDNQTKGKITNLISPSAITPATRMILTNALYFKGQWASPFNPHLTASAPFYKTMDDKVTTLFMNAQGSFSYTETDTFQVLSLPFYREEQEHARLACTFFLPKTVHPLSLTLHAFQEALRSLKATRLSVKLPKFKLRQNFNLNTPLKGLGMEIAFSDQANFSKIDGMRALCISQVLHESYFSLDEKGVEAAAATALTMSTTAATPSNPPIPFHANRPFLFMIVDLDTEGIYFIGKYRSP